MEGLCPKAHRPDCWFARVGHWESNMKHTLIKTIVTLAVVVLVLFLTAGGGGAGDQAA
jgi:hypothetical protein